MVNKGYTLVQVLVFTTLIMIGLTVVFQSWTNLIQREKEEELIFRGLQYVEGIRVFQLRYGRLPMKLEELIKSEPGRPRCIRKLWKDPITNSEKWGLIFQGNIKWPPIQPPAQEQETGGITGLPPSSIEIKPLVPFGEGEAPQMPIIGVFSTSTKESLRTYLGRKRYCDWEFTIMQVGKPGMPFPAPQTPDKSIFQKF